jgi:Tol biopolymer transport system component
MQRSNMLLAGSFAALVFAQCAMAAIPPQPQVFAPGEISTTVGVDCLAFMPDGKTVFFRQGPWSDGMIMLSHKVDGHWSRPVIAPFSGQWMDHDPAIAPDGSFLVYASNRPDRSGGAPLHGGHLWRVERTPSGWSKPERLPDTVNFGTYIFAPSIAANGDLYFQSRDNPSHQFHLYRSAWRDGHYQQAVRLKLMPDGMHELDPAIAPNGSFIVFDAGKDGSNQPDHLYLAFRTGHGWSKAVDIGKAIDQYQPWGAHLGPDGTTLYFTGNHATVAKWPRSHAQAERDLAKTRAWDNGTSHIYSVSLKPWLSAHATQSAASRPESATGVEP